MMQTDTKRKLEAEVSRFYEDAGEAFASSRYAPWDVMKLLADCVKPGDKVVDVGAGNGRLADVLPDGVDYLGIEPSSSLRSSGIASFKQKHGSRQGKHKENVSNPTITTSVSSRNLIQGSLPHLELPDVCADEVTCIAVLHHIPTKEQRAASVAELGRILKPGGYLLVTVWNLRSSEFWKRRFMTWRAKMAAWLRIPGFAGGDLGDLYLSWRAEGKNEKRYVHAFTFNEFRGMFDLNVWEIEKIGAYDRGVWASRFKGRNLVVMAKKK